MTTEAPQLAVFWGDILLHSVANVALLLSELLGFQIYIARKSSRYFDNLTGCQNFVALFGCWIKSRAIIEILEAFPTMVD